MSDAYDQALFFLAGVYAAERVREAQMDAHWRGRTLSREDIAGIFSGANEDMRDKINRTSRASAPKTASLAAVSNIPEE